MTTEMTDAGPRLMRYEDGEYLRPATHGETSESIEAAKRDGGAGAIKVGPVTCYVVWDDTLESEYEYGGAPIHCGCETPSEHESGACLPGFAL